MSAYWPWWAGALSLGLLTVGYAWLTRRTLGISGAWEHLLRWREEREVEAWEAQWASSLSAALMAEAPSGSPVATQVRPERLPAAPVPVAYQAVLIGSVFLGGLLAAVLSGRFTLRWDMGADFARIVTGDPVEMLGVLFGGGILVGFGTRLAGGCSSGHGLSGCSRLQPASLVATAVFFGTAVAVSFLLARI